MRICILFIFFFSLPITNQAIISDTYCVVDSQGKIVQGRNHLKHRAPASTVKLLTAMVVLDNLKPKAILNVSTRAASASPIKIYLKAGERMNCYNLLIAMLMRSANDAAHVLAEGVAGSQQRFAELMNQKARQLGCKNSNFVTPNGLPSQNQYSCAYDLALIALNARKYPVIHKILKFKEVIIYSEEGRRFTVKSHNHMLERKSPIYGKTGWTVRARHTFAGYCSRNKNTIAVAVMGAKSRPWSDLAYLTKQSSLSGKSKVGIQTALKNLGYYKGKIDGVFGPKTLQAIKKFQQENGLKVDGVVGKNTWNKLKQHR